MAKSKKTKKNAGTNQTGVQVQKLLQFIFPEGITTRLSHWAAVQADSDGYFTISFFEVRKPFLLQGSVEENRRVIDSIESIPATCIARVALMPDHFKRLGDAIQKTYEELSPKK